MKSSIRTGVKFNVFSFLFAGTIFVILLLGDGCLFDSKNHAPEISDILLAPSSITASTDVLVTAVATDKDGDKINYYWSFSAGRIHETTPPRYDPTTNPTMWQPRSSGNAAITCIVSDGKDKSSKSITVTVE